MIPIGVYIGLLLFSALIIIGGMIIVFKHDTSGQIRVNNNDNNEIEDPRGNNRRRTALGRRGRFDDDNDENNRELNINNTQKDSGKIGKKKAAKLAAKAQAKRDREALLAMREQKKAREEREYQERKAREAKEEEIERKIEEDEKLRQEQLAKKKQEEYEEWKNFISVEETGSDILDEDAKKKRIQEIIQYIKEKKIIMIEEIATVFKMKTSEIIDILQNLDETNELIGVIDDRGKFIYLEESELDQIAKFITRRGRVHVNEIHNECNKVIKLPEISLDESDFDE